MNEKTSEKQRWAFFRGCLIPIKLPHLEACARQVFPSLGIELVDFDFTCCPPTAVRDADEFKWLTIAAQNLALAERAGLDILTICNGCSQTLIEANHILTTNSDTLSKVNARLERVGLKYDGNVKVKHFLMVLHGMEERIKSSVKAPLRGFKVAAHPGCHILRPSEIIQFDDAERPVKLDQMISWLGASPVDYDLKALCCGQSFLPIDRRACYRVMADKLKQVKGADCLTTGCPMCFQQFDFNQKVMGLGFDVPVYTPVLFYPQLLGLAQGRSLEDVGWSFHKVKSEKLERFFSERE